MSMTIEGAEKRIISIRDEYASKISGLPPMLRDRTSLNSIVQALDMAVDALKEKAEREDPRPLTPDELRQMIGQPVWTVGVYLDGDTWAGWDIVDGFDNDGVTFGYSTEKPEWWAYDLRDQDGRLFGCAWVAYRHKPKEVQE